MKSVTALLSLPLFRKVIHGAMTDNLLLKIVKHRVVLGVRIKVLVLARNFVKNTHFFLSLLWDWIRHDYPPRLFFKIIMAFFFINIGIYWMLPGGAPAFGAPKPVVCPNGFAIELKEEFPGRYLKCEDFDSFYDLWADHKDREARALTFGR